MPQTAPSDQDFATKSDILLVKADLAVVKADLTAAIADLETRMLKNTILVAGVQTAFIALIFGAVRYLP